VVCLVLALLLVFVGTLAEVKVGLYAAQSDYFRSFLIYWTPHGTHLKIPVLPGGWLIGLVLLVNLLAAHIKRFKFSRKKIGIILIHAGLILLLSGQFLTELFQVEGQMLLEPGDVKNYSENARKNELVVVDTTDPNSDKVVAIPESLLAEGGEIRAPGLPFTLHVEKYYVNSVPAGPMTADPEKIKAADGLGKRLLFSPTSHATGMENVDVPTALVGVLSDKGPVGEWTVSDWFTRYPFFKEFQADIGRIMQGTDLNASQKFTYNGRNYEIALRPVRYYVPYTVKLLSFTHDRYLGTDVPKDFSSRIHLNDPKTGEDRDIRIYMNNPLRYRGETFYQSGFEPGDTGTILQVVRNPASLTPYVACSLVALGLVVQFLMHLFGFAEKRAQQTTNPQPRIKPGASPLEPALVNGKGGHRL
jgi:hypothetical protein